MGRKTYDTFPKIKLSNSVEPQNFTVSKEYRKESKQGISWTKEEIEALKTGIEKYGTKRWKFILSKYNNIFQGRRIVDLVSKYRLIQLDSSYYRTNKRDWIVVDDNNNPITDMMGEVILMSTKFPYDAAKKVAKKKIRSGEFSFLLRIREGNDLNKVHVYTVKKEFDGKVSLKKLAPSLEKE